MTISNINTNEFQTSPENTKKKKEKPQEVETSIDIKKEKKDKVDIADKNKDGKVSFEEKLEHKKKTKKFDLADKNKDGKISLEEKKEHDKKTMKLVKELVDDVKKDPKEKIELKDFKNITKMINTDIINTKESLTLNRFLDNQ